MTEVFVEQPLASPGSANYSKCNGEYVISFVSLTITMVNM